METYFCETKIIGDAGYLDNDIISYSHEWFTSQIETLFYGDPFESQQTLSEVRIFYDHASLKLRACLDSFFETEGDRIRQLALMHWRLFVDFDAAVDHQELLQYENDMLDVVTLSVSDSLANLVFLIQHDIVRPQYYNRFGHSLSFLAFQHGAIEAFQYLVSRMSPIHLLAPASVADTEDGRSILQLATLGPHMFSVCWSKIEEMPLNLRGVLSLEDVWNLCRFASVYLAGRMQIRGIDIADAAYRDPSLWLEIILYHKCPGPLFDWLYSNGCPPPEDFLQVYAARCYRFQAASWLSGFKGQRLPIGDGGADILPAERLMGIPDGQREQ